jgi:hypothetical protein
VRRVPDGVRVVSQCIGKRRFDSEADARVALDLIRSSPAAWERDKVPSKFYECDVCLGWHLTAMSNYDPSLRGRKKKVGRR